MKAPKKFFFITILLFKKFFCDRSEISPLYLVIAIADIIMVINHKMELRAVMKSMDNVRTICLGLVDRQMMDSTCVSSGQK